MAERGQWEYSIRTNIKEVIKEVQDLRDKVNNFENGDHTIKLNIDDKKLANVISNLDKMLTNLGKGTGDFKEFENLSSQLKDLVSEVKTFSKSFGSINDSGLNELLVSIQHIDKSLSKLIISIGVIKKNLGNIGNINGSLKKLGERADSLGKSVKNVGDSLKSVASDSGITIEFNNITKAAERASKAVDKVTDSVEKQKKQELAEKLKTYNTSLKQSQNSYKRYNTGKPTDKDRSVDYKNILNEYQNAIQNLESELKRLNNLDVELVSEKDIKNLEALSKAVSEIEVKINQMPSAQKGSTIDSRWKEIDKINNYLRINTKISKDARAQLEAFVQSLKDVDGINVSQIHRQFLEISNAEITAGREGKKFFDILKDKSVYGLATQIASYYLSLMDMIRYAQNAFNAVRELDTALIDLKKTTTMTSQELETFYTDANNVAINMGVATKEIIEQASAWSRLGYSTKDAATKMAELSSQFASISPGMGTEDAQEGLVSIMKAWDIATDQVEREVMDNINVLGNKFAETNQDIVEGMKRSAATLSALGQSWNDSFAIFTGAQEVIQNAETVGTALKTLSLRIRGYSEETEELDDSLINITGDVIDLTKTTQHAQGVSLFTDETQQHYRSMVDYLRDISNIWDEIDEKNRTALLEKLFGKRGASVGSAIIGNFDSVEKALTEMENAAGSADREMDTIRQSLDYKINALKETWVGIAQNLLDRGVIGQWIDAFTKLSQALGWVVDKMKLLGALGAILGAKKFNIAQYTKDNGFQLFGKQLGMRSAEKYFMKNVNIQGLVKTNTTVEEVAQNYNLANSKAIKFYEEVYNGNIKLQEGEKTLKAYKKYLAETSTGFKGFGAALKNIGGTLKGVMGSLGSGVINALGGYITGLVAGQIINRAISLYKKISGKAAEEARQKVRELGETARSEFQNIQDSLKSTISTVDEVKGRYAELAQDVENLGNSNQSRGNLSVEDYNEFLSISNELAGIMPDLTKTYDSNGNAILNLSGSVEIITQKLEDFLDVQRQIAAKDMLKQMPDIFNDYGQTVSEYADKYNDAYDMVRAYKDIIENGYNLQNVLQFTDKNKSALFDSLLASGLSEEVANQVAYWSENVNFDEFDSVTQQKIESVFQNMYNQYVRESNEYSTKIQQENKQLGLEIAQTLYDNVTYQDIAKNDETKKAIIDSIIPNLGYDTLTAEFDNFDEVSTFISDKIVDAINNIDDSAIETALNEILNNPDISIDDRANFLQQITEYFNQLYGEDNVISVSFKAQVEEANELQKSLGKVTSRLKDSKKIKDFFDLEGINTQEEIDNFNKLTAGIHTADEAIQAYYEHAKKQVKTPEMDFNPSTAFDTMKKALEEQSKQGFITDETLQSLTKTYGELNDVVSYTPNGIVLSTEAMVGLTEQTAQAALVSTQMKEAIAIKDYQKAAKVVQNHEKKYKGLINAYKKGTASARQFLNTQKNLTAQQRNDILQDLNKASTLGEQVKAYSMLEAQIRATTSAINLYKIAQETPNNKDNFDTAREGLASAKEAFKKGWTGTDDYKTFIDYIGAYNKEMNNYTKPEEYFGRAKRYLTEDISGIYNFLNDAVAKSTELEASWVTKTGSHYDIAIDDIGEFAKEMNMTTSFVTDMLLAASEAWNFDINFSSLTDGLEDTISEIKELPRDSLEAKLAIDDMAATIAKLKEAGYDVSNLEEEFKAISQSTIQLVLEISEKSVTEVLKEASEIAQEVEKKSGVNIDFSANKDELESQLREIHDYRATLTIGTQDYDDATLTIAGLIASKHELEKPAILEIDDSELNETGVLLKQMSDAIYQLQYYEGTLGVDSEEYKTAKRNVDNLYDSLKEVNDYAQTGIANDFNFSIKADIDSFNASVKQLDVNKVLSDSQTTTKIKADDKPARKVLKNFVDTVRVTTASAIITGKLESNFFNNLQSLIKASGIYTVSVKGSYTGTSGGGGKPGGGGGGGAPFGVNTYESQSARTLNTNSSNENELSTGTSIHFADDSDLPTNKTLENILDGVHTIVKNDGASGGGDDWGGGSGGGGGGGGGNPSGGGGGGSSEDEKTPETFDWIEIKIKRITEAIEKLAKIRDNTYITWSKRNSTLNDEMAKTEEAIKVQEEAYAGYLGAANAVGLDEQWAQKVRDGKIEIEKITDETLKQQIQEYQEWYEKMIECDMAAQDLRITLSELTKIKFDNIKSEFEGILSLIENQSNILDAKLAQLEAKGYFANADYYSAQIKENEDLLAKKKLEYASLYAELSNAVATGAIEEGSEAWYEMYGDIQKVAQEITEAETNTIKLKNAIRQIEWDKFDFGQDRISAFADEAQFLIDLLGDDLYNDNGTLNKNGQAANGMHAVRYNTFMSQAQAYGEEYKKITEELAKDPNNKTLIERREQLLKLQQDAIKNANSEKEAIKSLVQEGINLHLQGIQSTIDKYKEELRVAKDLYSYQKNIADQTKNIADLEKIMAAYSGDDSEEARKIIQETQVSLDEAKQKLEETQYDKYISDTEELLDTLYSDYSDVLNARLDDIDALIADMIDEANQNAGDIQDAIGDATEKVGYDPTWGMKALIDTAANGSDMVSKFNGTFDNMYTTTRMIYDALLDAVRLMGHDYANGDDASTYKPHGGKDNGQGIEGTPERRHVEPTGAVKPHSDGDTEAKPQPGFVEKSIKTGNPDLKNGLSMDSRIITGNPSWRNVTVKNLNYDLDNLKNALKPISEDFINDYTNTINKIFDGKLGNNNNDTHIEIILPNAKDYDSFVRDLKNDAQMTAYIQNITIGQAMGMGSLTKNKY